MIRTHQLGHRIQYGDETLVILNEINLDITRGESVAIVGASGSGKSTLLGLLAGLDTPSEGNVWLAEQELTAMDEEQRARVRLNNVAFVFQNFQLLGSLTALENVLLPLELKQVTNAREQALQFLDHVGLSHRLTHYPLQLSGGEQQRVALARAFACRAPVLFADEPTGNLDNHTGEQVADLLFELNQNSATTLVLVTHDLRLAARCQRQLVLHQGRIEGATDAATKSGTTAEGHA